MANRTYPLGTRTGVASVDRVLTAIESHDAGEIAAAIHYFPLSCTDGTGFGARPCPAGKPVGTPVDVVGYSGCEGGYALRGDAANITSITSAWATIERRLYGVVAQPVSDKLEVPAGYVIILLKTDPSQSGASASALSVDQSGITYFSGGCGQEIDAFAAGRAWLFGPAP